MIRLRALPILVLAGCGGEGIMQLVPSEQLVVARYLECTDCIAPLDSVRALASRKPDATVDALNAGLVRGPDSSAMAQAESLLAVGYVRDSSWRVIRQLPLLPPRDTVVAQESERFVNGYRARGAIGMGYIHTPRAVAYLDSALTLPLPPSVLFAVRYARDSLPPPR